MFPHIDGNRPHGLISIVTSPIGIDPNRRIVLCRRLGMGSSPQRQSRRRRIPSGDRQGISRCDTGRQSLELSTSPMWFPGCRHPYYLLRKPPCGSELRSPVFTTGWPAPMPGSSCCAVAPSRSTISKAEPEGKAAFRSKKPKSNVSGRPCAFTRNRFGSDTPRSGSSTTPASRCRSAAQIECCNGFNAIPFR